MTSAPSRSTEPSPNGSNRNASPANPSAKPTYADACRRRPKATRSSSAIQIGMLPTSSAATPAGTVCCAHASDPWPRRNRRPPKTRPARTCFRPIGSSSRSPRGSANDEQRCAGDEVPHGHREVRREVAHDDRERDERRAPHEVDRDQGEPDPRVATRRHASQDAASRDDQLKSSSARERSERLSMRASVGPNA